MANAPKPEIKELLKKYNELKKEEKELAEKDPEKSAQKKWDANQVAKEIEKHRE